MLELATLELATAKWLRRIKILTLNREDTTLPFFCPLN